MASLSRRLTVIAERGKSGNYGISDALVADLESAAAVCAAVEAFQAADKAREDARAIWENNRQPGAVENETDRRLFQKWEAANERLSAAKARLLEVNLT